jgi:hypothetical protein
VRDATRHAGGQAGTASLPAITEDLVLVIAKLRQSRPLIEELHGWLEKALATLSRKSETAPAALRAFCLGRKSCSSQDPTTGECAAATYTLTGSAKLNSLDPELNLRQVLERIADHPSERISELLPWNISLPTQTHSYKCSHISVHTSTGDSSVAYDSQSKIGQGEIDLTLLASRRLFINLLNRHYC